MGSSSLRRISDDSDSPQSVPAAGKEEEKEEREGNAGQSEGFWPDNPNSWSGVKSESEGTADEEGKMKAEGEMEKRVIAAEDREDGFRTPTSSEYRIPAMTECPPAPRKHHRSRWKRRRRLELDTSEEVESLFRPVNSGDEEGGAEPENKKARKEDEGIEIRLSLN